ncbi:MAG: hypothetical protein SOY32_08685 [Candidatus Faecousia sp.]|nr:hypothetical protein [Bacillota bacterium]MDY4220479.1 hypothetical protein [Candidatus Faecousia sp.]
MQVIVHEMTEIMQFWSFRLPPDDLLMGNLHSNNVPQNISDSLRLCSEEDVELLSGIVKLLVDRQNEKWNTDNFV